MMTHCPKLLSNVKFGNYHLSHQGGIFHLLHLSKIRGNPSSEHSIEAAAAPPSTAGDYIYYNITTTAVSRH